MEKKLAEILAKMKKIDSDQELIEREAKLQNDGNFTDEQREQYEALQQLFDDLKAQKEKIEKDMTLIAGRDGRGEVLKLNLPGRATPANSGAPVRNSPVGMPIESNGDDGEPQIRFKIPRNIFRGTRLTNFHGTRDGLDAEHRAYRFGQWILARASVDLPGRFNFQFAKDFVSSYVQPLNVAHQESGSAGSTTGGHFLVPDEFNRDLIDLRERYGVARRLFRQVPMSSDVMHTPRRSSGLTAYFVNESDAGTESNMTWSDIQLVAKDMMILARVSNQLNADSVISLGDTLAGEIAYAFSLKEDQCAFSGDGTSTYGGITGIRTLLTSIDGAGTDSAGLKIQGTSNTWSAQVMADFHAVVGKLPAYADTPNTCWVCHKTYYCEVMQKLELATGGNTINEVANGDRRPRPLFLGYPVEFSQVFPSVTATTGVTAVLGDFTLGAMFGDRQQTSVAFSEHATVGSSSVFERNQIAVRGTERFDINIHGYGDASTPGPIVGLATA